MVAPTMRIREGDPLLAHTDHKRIVGGGAHDSPAILPYAA